MMVFFDRMFISLALTVESVLQSGDSAMQNGGAFSAQSAKVDQIGGGLYHIFYKAGIYVALVVAICAGIKLMVSNTQNRTEAKSNLFWAGLGIVVVSSAATLIVIVSDIGSGLATDLVPSSNG